MIQFRQKTFSEYDAMRTLYVELLKRGDRNKWKVIDRDSLIPVLRGNNVVVERFVIDKINLSVLLLSIYKTEFIFTRNKIYTFQKDLNFRKCFSYIDYLSSME